MLIESRAQFPSKLRPLFAPKRYKIIRGGRGAAKSWGVARALIQMSVQRKLDILCGREYQSSIRDSVHKLLRGQIEGMGLGALFRVERDVIYSPRGGQFVFVGLADKTAENMKSYEDFDIGWIEEAQVLSRRSLNILTPTIRKEGSELIFTYNPELDSDPIEEFSNSLTPEEGVVIEMNWRDNPWFNATMEAERARAERTMWRQDYENIWEGKLRPAVAGAIYAEEIGRLLAEQRFGDFPPDPFHRVYPVFDLGWNDQMVIGCWQRNLSQLRCIDYIEDDHKPLDWYSRALRDRPYNYGKIILPHDGDHGDYRSDQGKSAKQILEGLGWQVQVLPVRSIEEGIRETRMAMRQMYVDRTRCAPWKEHMRRYRRSIPKTTGEAAGPVHDAHSHCADMTRYAVQGAQLMDDEGGMDLPPLNYPDARPV